MIHTCPHAQVPTHIATTREDVLTLSCHRLTAPTMILSGPTESANLLILNTTNISLKPVI